MLTISFVHKASGMLAINQVDMLVLSAGIARQKGVQLTSVLNQRVSRRWMKTRRGFQNKSRVVDEPMVGIKTSSSNYSHNYN